MDRLVHAYERSCRRYASTDEPRRYKWGGYSIAELRTVWDEIAALVPAEARILELGLGGGHLAEALRPDPGRYVGIDIVRANVDAAKARVPALDVRVANMWEFLARRRPGTSAPAPPSSAGDGAGADRPRCGWDFVVSVGCAFSHIDFVGKGREERERRASILFDLIEIGAPRGFLIICADDRKRGLSSAFFAAAMEKAVKRSRGVSVAYCSGPREFLNGFKYRTRVLFLLREGRRADASTVLPRLPGSTLWTPEPESPASGGGTVGPSAKSDTPATDGVVVVLMERHSWKPDHRSPPFPFAREFEERMARLGLEVDVVLHPRKLLAAIERYRQRGAGEEKQMTEKKPLRAVLLLACPVGDSYVNLDTSEDADADTTSTVAGMLRRLRRLQDEDGVPVVPPLPLIEYVNSKAYSKDLERARLALPGTQTLLGPASRDAGTVYSAALAACMTCDAVATAAPALSSSSASVPASSSSSVSPGSQRRQPRARARAMLKKGWSYEGLNVLEVSMSMPADMSSSAVADEPSAAALAEVEQWLDEVNRTKNWGTSVDLRQVEGEAGEHGCLIVQPFNPTVTLRRNEFRAFFLRGRFAGFFAHGGKIPSERFDESRVEHREALRVCTAVVRALFTDKGAATPSILRVDVTYCLRATPAAADAAAASSSSSSGSSSDATQDAEERVWYCNEIEVHPSFYFHLPILAAVRREGDGSKASLTEQGDTRLQRTDDFQRDVLGTIADMLREALTKAKKERRPRAAAGGAASTTTPPAPPPAPPNKSSVHAAACMPAIQNLRASKETRKALRRRPELVTLLDITDEDKAVAAAAALTGGSRDKYTHSPQEYTELFEPEGLDPQNNEIPPDVAVALLRALRLGPHDSFLDLGSSCGALVLAAAATTPCGRVGGVELSPSSHALALEALGRHLDKCPGDEGRIKLRQGYLRRCPELLDRSATVLYCAIRGHTSRPKIMHEVLTILTRTGSTGADSEAGSGTGSGESESAGVLSDAPPTDEDTSSAAAAAAVVAGEQEQQRRGEEKKTTRRRRKRKKHRLVCAGFGVDCRGRAYEDKVRLVGAFAIRDGATGGPRALYCSSGTGAGPRLLVEYEVFSEAAME